MRIRIHEEMLTFHLIMMIIGYDLQLLFCSEAYLDIYAGMNHFDGLRAHIKIFKLCLRSIKSTLITFH